MQLAEHLAKPISGILKWGSSQQLQIAIQYTEKTPPSNESSALLIQGLVKLNNYKLLYRDTVQIPTVILLEYQCLQKLSLFIKANLIYAK